MKCRTCEGWVPPIERIHTDEGIFHDRLRCLSEDRFEELVARYGCRCETVETYSQAEWFEHLQEEHRKPLDVGRKRDRYLAEEISPALAVITPVVGAGSRASASERPLKDHADMGKPGAGSFLAVDGREPRGRNARTAATPAVVDPAPTTLIPGEYDSDDLDRLVR